ncbi:MAG: DUF2934 domain-containing protein [Planctomycetota bacterium]
MATKAQKTESKNTKAKRVTTAKPKAAARPKAALTVSDPVVVEPAKPVAEAGPVPSNEAIAAKAYEIWVAKGRPVGQDKENWAQAEAALRGA